MNYKSSKNSCSTMWHQFISSNAWQPCRHSRCMSRNPMTYLDDAIPGPQSNRTPLVKAKYLRWLTKVHGIDSSLPQFEVMWPSWSGKLLLSASHNWFNLQRNSWITVSRSLKKKKKKKLRKLNSLHIIGSRPINKKRHNLWKSSGQK